MLLVCVICSVQGSRLKRPWKSRRLFRRLKTDEIYRSKNKNKIIDRCVSAIFLQNKYVEYRKKTATYSHLIYVNNKITSFFLSLSLLISCVWRPSGTQTPVGIEGRVGTHLMRSDCYYVTTRSSIFYYFSLLVPFYSAQYNK